MAATLTEESGRSPSQAISSPVGWFQSLSAPAKLFADGGTVPLKPVSSTTFDTGVLHLVYASADAETGAN